jgi:hypothetical protein
VCCVDQRGGGVKVEEDMARTPMGTAAARRRNAGRRDMVSGVYELVTDGAEITARITVPDDSGWTQAGKQGAELGEA